MSNQPEFERLLREIERLDPRLASSVTQLEQSWSEGQRDAAITEAVSRVINGAAAQGTYGFETMVQGFQTFAHDFEDRQIDFLRFGHYRAKDYDAVSRDVYSNHEFMWTVYYPALLLGYVASPNYRHIVRSLDRILPEWANRGVSRVLDVGSGHAFLVLYALNELPAARGLGTDIASAASDFAAAIQRASGWGAGRFEFSVSDILAAREAVVPESFDAAICCELLEHVPEPHRFLHAIHDRLSSHGRLFVSAAIRMESVDHLTLFDSTDVVTGLLAECGFEVVQEMSVPFVKRKPAGPAEWKKLLGHPRTPATFVAECAKTS